MKNIIISIILFLAGLSSSFAAQFEIKKYTNSEKHYIQMTGNVAEGDGYRLRYQLKDAIFDNYTPELILHSPGGDSRGMHEVLEVMKEKKFKTRVSNTGRCMSACAIIWTHGHDRVMESKAIIGFHVSSVYGPGVVEFIDAYGYTGFQSYVQESFKDSIEFYLTFDIPNPQQFALNVALKGYNAENFYILSEADAIQIMGGRVIN